jgi:hypothetical protein
MSEITGKPSEFRPFDLPNVLGKVRSAADVLERRTVPSQRRNYDASEKNSTGGLAE